MGIFGLQGWARVDIDSEQSDISNLTDEFISTNKAWLDYYSEEAGAYYKILQSIKIGDIVYLKNCDWSKRTLDICAIGIVADNEMIQENPFAVKYNCLKEVRWFKLDSYIHIDIRETAKDRANGDPYAGSVFGITLYEEYSPYIQNIVLNEIFKLMEK